METLGSARIEGNRTTLADYIEDQITRPRSHGEKSLELANLERAYEYVESAVHDRPIDKSMICDLHRMVVEGLTPNTQGGEGDLYPGRLRDQPVSIAGARHRPVELHSEVERCVDELIEFINQDAPAKKDLLITAIAHHRFMWIHPFGNGNGRVGRLLTYAMLIRKGFSVERVINPTAVFCLSREQYNDHLADADDGSSEGLTRWCEFVLDGLHRELEKIDQLLEFSFFSKRIVLPALRMSLQQQLITPEEHKILQLSIEKDEQYISAGDIMKLLRTEKSVSYKINQLKAKKMLDSVPGMPRKYHLRFDNNYILRGIVQALKNEGYLTVE
jgi:Fic family protein